MKKIFLILFLFLFLTSCNNESNNELETEEYLKSVTGAVPNYTIEISNKFNWENASENQRNTLIQVSILRCVAMSDEDIAPSKFDAIAKTEDGKLIFTWNGKEERVVIWKNNKKEVLKDKFEF